MPTAFATAFGFTSCDEELGIEPRSFGAVQINQAGLTVGTFADSPEAAKRWIDADVRYIALSVDTGIYLHGCRDMVNSVRG